MANEPNGDTAATPAGLDGLLGRLVELQAQEQSLAAQLEALRARRQALEAQLAGILSANLDPDAVRAIAQALAGPGGTRGLGAAPLQIKGVNYYPSKHPWWRMWCEWDEALITQEIGKAAALGANTIRTFVPLSLLSTGPLGQQVRAQGKTDAATVLERVDRFLTITAGQGMSTILGLFDESDLLLPAIHDLPTSLAYIDQVVNYVGSRGIRLGEDRRIAMWDLVNEWDDGQKTDPPTPPGGKAPPGARQLFLKVGWPGPVYTPNADGLGWLRRMYTEVLRLSADYQQVTLSALNPFSVLYLLKNGFDDPRHVPQYHEYPSFANPAAATKLILQDMQIIAKRTGRKVLIGECGAPSKGAEHDVTWTPNLQSGATKTLLDTVSQHTEWVLGVLIWTLTDFDFAAASENAEKYHGLLDKDGQEKPAAAIVKQVFKGAV